MINAHEPNAARKAALLRCPRWSRRPGSYDTPYRLVSADKMTATLALCLSPACHFAARELFAAGMLRVLSLKRIDSSKLQLGMNTATGNVGAGERDIRRAPLRSRFFTLR